MALGMAYFCRYIFRCLIPGFFGYTWFFRSYQTLLARLGSFSHTRLDRVSGSPIVVGDDGGVVVGDDIGVAILDILFGYARFF